MPTYKALEQNIYVYNFPPSTSGLASSFPGHEVDVVKIETMFIFRFTHPTSMQGSHLLVTDQVTWSSSWGFSTNISLKPLGCWDMTPYWRDSWIFRLGTFHRRKSFALWPQCALRLCTHTSSRFSLISSLGSALGKLSPDLFKHPSNQPHRSCNPTFYELGSLQLWLKLCWDTSLSGRYCCETSFSPGKPCNLSSRVSTKLMNTEDLPPTYTNAP